MSSSSSNSSKLPRLTRRLKASRCHTGRDKDHFRISLSISKSDLVRYRECLQHHGYLIYSDAYGAYQQRSYCEVMRQKRLTISVQRPGVPAGTRLQAARNHCRDQTRPKNRRAKTLPINYNVFWILSRWVRTENAGLPQRGSGYTSQPNSSTTRSTSLCHGSTTALRCGAQTYPCTGLPLFPNLLSIQRY